MSGQEALPALACLTLTLAPNPGPQPTQEALQLFKAYDVDASGQLELPEVEFFTLLTYLLSQLCSLYLLYLLCSLHRLH
jgi:hypothetical protein